MAVGTVLAVEAVLAAHDVAADRAGGELKLRQIEACFSEGHRLVGRAVHRLENRGYLLLTVVGPRRPGLLHPRLGGRGLGGLHHIEPERRGGRFATPDGGGDEGQKHGGSQGGSHQGSNRCG